MKKKNRKINENIKNIKNMKTLEDRIEFVKIIKNKIESLGLSNNFESISKFYNILEIYEKKGQSFSGKIKLLEVGKTLQYVLSNRKIIQNNVEGC